MAIVLFFIHVQSLWTTKSFIRSQCHVLLTSEFLQYWLTLSLKSLPHTNAHKIINFSKNFMKVENVWFTIPFKIKHPVHNILRMYWTDFWQLTVYAQQTIFEKNLIEVCSPHLYASFGTFCVKIGRLFVAQRVFRHTEEFWNRRHFPLMTAICRFSNILQRLPVPRIKDHFRRKWCQKSVKMWTTNFY